jgi:transcriptional regulator NrdR family protein
MSDVPPPPPPAVFTPVPARDPASEGDDDDDRDVICNYCGSHVTYVAHEVLVGGLLSFHRCTECARRFTFHETRADFVASVMKTIVDDADADRVREMLDARADDDAEREVLRQCILLNKKRTARDAMHTDTPVSDADIARFALAELGMPRFEAIARIHQARQRDQIDRAAAAAVARQ